MKNVMTDRLEVLNLGGNKGVTGNIAVLAPCVGLRELDFNLCKVFGEVRVLERCSLLKSLDLGDTKVSHPAFYLLQMVSVLFKNDLSAFLSSLSRIESLSLFLKMQRWQVTSRASKNAPVSPP